MQGYELCGAAPERCKITQDYEMKQYLKLSFPGRIAREGGMGTAEILAELARSLTNDPQDVAKILHKRKRMHDRQECGAGVW